MKKFAALLTKEMAQNEWENEESDFLQDLCSVYKN